MRPLCLLRANAINSKRGQVAIHDVSTAGRYRTGVGAIHSLRIRRMPESLLKPSSALMVAAGAEDGPGAR